MEERLEKINIVDEGRCCICRSKEIVFKTIDEFSFCKDHEKYKKLSIGCLNMLLHASMSMGLSAKHNEERGEDMLKEGCFAPRYALKMWVLGDWLKTDCCNERYYELEEAIEHAEKENESTGGADKEMYTAIFDIYENKIVWNPFEGVLNEA